MKIEGIYMRSDNKNLIVTKANTLIEARYKLTHNQQRILLTLATQVHQQDEDLKDYVLRVSDVMEMWKITDTTFYTKAEEAIVELIKNERGIIYFEDDEDVEITRWLSYAKYRKGSGTIKIRFDSSVKKYFLQLKEHFTQYPISAISQFRSNYSIRLYELLKQKQNMGKGKQFYRLFTVQEFRWKMGIEDGEYKNFNDLSRFVLKPATEEINKLSDLSVVDVYCAKEGRTYATIKITAEPKNQLIIDYDDTPEAQQEQAKKTRKLPKVYEELLAVGISDTTARNWIKKYGSKRIARNLAYTLAMKQTSEIGNIGGYMARIISQDIGEQWANEQAKQTEALKTRKQAENKQDAQYEEQRGKDKAERDKMIAVFEGFNDDERGFYLDELEQRFKGLRKAKFEIAKRGYTSTKSTGIFSEFFLEIRDLLTSHGLL